MAIGEPLPPIAWQVSRKVFRHVLARDAVPALPPLRWGSFAHAGPEYRYQNGAWVRHDQPVTQMRNVRDLPQAVLSIVAPLKRRDASRYALADHQPHRYIAALRPAGVVTEYGDRDS
jgi:hypothetical protein